MAISRRTLLGLIASGAGWPMLLPRLSIGGGPPVYLSARASGEDVFSVSGFSLDGRPVFDLPLPERGHSFAVSPKGDIAVHFARRPGSFAKVIHLSRGTVLNEITPPVDRHFYGHGVFSLDGRLLYATENDFDGERGVIGIYDVQLDYRRIGEFPSHGVGPHEISLLSDGETLVVANGGIATHPDLPRVKLNLPTMLPSLVYLNRRDGMLLENRRLVAELHQLSIRHIARGRDDRVALAMQYEGPAGDIVPLVGTHQKGQEIRLLKGPPDVLRSMKQYCGSIAFDRSGRVFGVTSPRGNTVTFWDADTGRLSSESIVLDGCGIAPGFQMNSFVVSSGRGGVAVVDAETGKMRPIVSAFVARGCWDNHMVTTGL